MSFEECRDDALKEWQKCAGEAIRNEYPRRGALGDCVRTHRRKADACERLPKEKEQIAGRPEGLRSDPKRYPIVTSL